METTTEKIPKYLLMGSTRLIDNGELQDDGVDVYTRQVEETTTIDGYTTVITGNAADGYVVDNQHTPCLLYTSRCV